MSRIDTLTQVVLETCPSMKAVKRYYTWITNRHYRGDKNNQNSQASAGRPTTEKSK